MCPISLLEVFVKLMRWNFYSSFMSYLLHHVTIYHVYFHVDEDPDRN